MAKKKSYIVRWGVEIERASSAKNAAEIAHRNHSWLRIYFVTDQKTGETTKVNLDEKEN